MKDSYIPFDNKLKKLLWQDIAFYKLDTSDIPTPDQQEGQSNLLMETHFKSKLLKYLNDKTGEKVLRLFLINPIQLSGDFFGFLFLESKHILPVQFYPSSPFLEGMKYILEEDKRDSQWLMSFADNEFSLRGVGGPIKMNNLIFDETGKYLHDSAPKKFNAAKIAREKATFLKKYAVTEIPDINAEEIKAAFENYLEVKHLKAIPPIDNNDIYNTFEMLSGYAFPAPLKQLFQWHNGIENTSFLTAHQMLKAWKSWKEIYDEWTLEELRGNTDPDGKKTLGMYTTPYWVPFFSTGDGNFIGLDLAPNKAGTPGQVIRFGADEYKIQCMQNDLASFLRYMADL